MTRRREVDDTHDGRRGSKNDYTYQWLEKVDQASLRSLLNDLRSDDVRVMTKQIRIRALPAGHITAQHAELVRHAALTLYAAGAVRFVCHILVQDVAKRSKEILADNYGNPTARNVGQLTDQLLEQFGPLKTKVYYACAIDDEVSATRLLLKEISRRPEIQVDLYVHDESPVNVAEPRPTPSEEVKSSRKERRLAERESRAARRSQESTSRRNEKFVQSRRSKRPRGAKPSDERGETVLEFPISVTKLRHGHLTRYRKASTDHPDVGAVKAAFVSYGKDDPQEGKTRPCVIVAVAPSYCIVRPIYSRASHFAGKWRAVVLTDWEEAGLDHESVVGHKTEKVRRHLVGRHIGTLTIQDWNRVCRGEVNNVSGS